MKYVDKARQEIRKILREYVKTEEAVGPEYEMLMWMLNILDGREFS